LSILSIPNEDALELKAASDSPGSVGAPETVLAKPPRAVRDEMRVAHVSVSEAARRANVAPNTWRLYSADRFAVSEAVRQRCDAALEWIRGLAKAREAA
jgi:hypothetical protein